MRISRPSNRSAIRVPPSPSILNDLALRMVLLDTNVISEAIKPEPHPSVLAWPYAQAAETLFLSSITVAELLFGIGALPDGKRKGHAGSADRRLAGPVRRPHPVLRHISGAALCRSRRQ